MRVYRRSLSWVLAATVFCGAAGLMPYSVLGNPATVQAADKDKEERHPHVHAAIHELRDAKKDLEKADHDFGGHRVEAIKAIDHAIVQLEKCLKHDKE